jgi:hypothetical protein
MLSAFVISKTIIDVVVNGNILVVFCLLSMTNEVDVWLTDVFQVIPKSTQNFVMYLKITDKKTVP